MKRNKLRRVYLIYTVAAGELVIAAMLLAAGYIPDEGWKLALRIICCIGFVIMPVAVWIMYHWFKKDNDMMSDEFEQMVLTKAFAVGGLVAASLIPFLLVVVSLFTDWAALFVFIFSVFVWGTIKLTAFILYRKY